MARLHGNPGILGQGGRGVAELVLRNIPSVGWGILGCVLGCTWDPGKMLGSIRESEVYTMLLGTSQ